MPTYKLLAPWGQVLTARLVWLSGDRAHHKYGNTHTSIQIINIPTLRILLGNFALFYKLQQTTLSSCGIEVVLQTTSILW